MNALIKDVEFKGKSLRIPYDEVLADSFGIDNVRWKVLVDVVFPNATSAESIIMACAYCKSRNLDIFKRPVHIVPMWSSAAKGMIDTVWPSISELRTTAFRTGNYAGRDETKFGPDLTKKVGAIEFTFPEWAQVTVYRSLAGQRVPFPGPRVYWLESYAKKKKDDDTPNEMWQRRPHGQIEKCAEAAALRGAFPEEIGNEYAAEEMEGQRLLSEAAPTPPAPEADAERRTATRALEPPKPRDDRPYNEAPPAEDEAPPPAEPEGDIPPPPPPEPDTIDYDANLEQFADMLADCSEAADVDAIVNAAAWLKGCPTAVRAKAVAHYKAAKARIADGATNTAHAPGNALTPPAGKPDAYVDGWNAKLAGVSYTKPPEDLFPADLEDWRAGWADCQKAARGLK